MIVTGIIHLSIELTRAIQRSFLRLLRGLERRRIAASIRRELSAQPDVILRDLGMTRGNLGYAARALATRRSDRIRLLVAAALIASASVAVPDAGIARDVSVETARSVASVR